MDSVKFKVGDRIFELSRSKIPDRSLLHSLVLTSMRVEKDEGVIILSEDDDETPAFEAVVQFLLHGTFPSWEHLPTFDYLGLDPRSNYDLALTLEEEMRAKMYHPEYQDHPMNTNPHYGLIELTEDLWNELELKRPSDPDLLFNHSSLQKQSWKQVQGSLQEFESLFSVPGLFIAGGRVFSALFGTRSSDVDLFFYGSQDPEDGRKRLDQVFELLRPSAGLIKERTELGEESRSLRLGVNREDRMKTSLLANLNEWTIPEKKKELPPLFLRVAESIGFKGEFRETPGNSSVPCGDVFFHLKREPMERIKEIEERLKELRPQFEMTVTRTSNAMTFLKSKKEYQVILRLYRSPSEILHGFDVDSCCFGWDGKKIWMTQRALYSIYNGINTVNFDRLSPSYERRLAKYGTRGIAVKIPNFSRQKVDQAELEKRCLELAKKKEEWDKGKRKWVETNVEVGIDYQRLRDPRKDPLRGLDTLIFLDFQSKKRNYGIKTVKAIENLAADVSDYSGTPSKSQNGARINTILFHLINSRDEFPEAAAKYLPYLEGSWIGDYEDPYFDDPDLNSTLDFTINMIPQARQIDFIRLEHSFYSNSFERQYRLLLDLPQRIFDCLGTVRSWIVPRQLEWKITNPGQQFTGTFHRTVLEDKTVWYQGRFYHL